MFAKKLAIGILGFIGISFFCTGCFSKKNNEIAIENKNIEVKQTPQVVIKQEKVPKYDLYSDSLYDLPLISILEISTLPEKIKKIIDELLESSQGFYFLKKYDDRVFVILQNSVSNTNTYPRHNLEFAEIDLDGNITYHKAGYEGIEDEISNAIVQKEDLWNFDESVEPFRPKKHVVYNEKGKVKFIELWDYEENEPIKYQMKNSHKKVISILKESQDNDLNLRREHIFYDDEGNITMSLTINYEGANISRLMFYNSQNTNESISILSEYTNGHKTKELIYDEAYKLLHTAIADYNEEKRTFIKLLDSNNDEILKISS